MHDCVLKRNQIYQEIIIYKTEILPK